MKIVFVSQYYYPFLGGVEIHARQVVHSLAERHEVTMVAGKFASFSGPKKFTVLSDTILNPPYPDGQDGPVAVYALAPNELWQRLTLLPTFARVTPVLRGQAYNGLNRFGYTWYRAAYKDKLRRICEGADVIHSLAFGYPGWLAAEVAREVGAALVCTPFVHPHQWGDGPDDTAFYKKCDAVIGLVPTDREYLVSLGLAPEKVHVIGVSPDLPEKRDGAGFRERHSLGDDPLVVYVGRMMRQKGAVDLLAAMPQVWEQEPRTRFLFIGPASVEEAKAFEGIDPRARYLGKVSSQEKADALAACNIFCMPSMSEILPTVYLEAWTCEKPVVGGKAHGLTELVEGNGGGFAVSQEPREIADALLKLVRSPELRVQYGKQGAKVVAERYSVPAVTNALERLYSNVQRAGQAVVGRQEATLAAAE